MIYFIDAIRLVQEVTCFHFVHNNHMHVYYIYRHKYYERTVYPYVCV